MFPFPATLMFNASKVDCALLLSCGKALRNKIQRGHYVSLIWDNADTSQPAVDLDPLHYGLTTNSFLVLLNQIIFLLKQKIQSKLLISLMTLMTKLIALTVIYNLT